MTSMMKLLALGLAAVGLASAIPKSQIDSSPVSTLQKRSIDQGLFLNLKRYAEFSGAAYCPANLTPAAPLPRNVTCKAPDVCPDINNNTAVQVQFSGQIQNLAFTLFTGGIMAIPANYYIALDNVNKAVVVAFQGTDITDSSGTVLIDFGSSTNAAFNEPGCTNCSIGSTFLSAFNNVKSAVSQIVSSRINVAERADWRVIMAGHSLGGDLATVAATTFRAEKTFGTHPVDLYTYGAGPIGNQAFVNFATKQDGAAPGGRNYRVTHIGDLVPRLSINNFQFGPEYYITQPGATTVTRDSINFLAAQFKPNGDFVPSSQGASTNVISTPEGHRYYITHISGTNC